MDLINNENYQKYIQYYGFKKFCKADIQYLTVLDLYFYGIGDEGFELLTQMDGIQSLTNLNIGSCHISHKGIKFIANIILPRLTSLYLGGNNIDNTGIIYIAEFLKNNKSLKELYLNDNDININEIQFTPESFNNLIELHLDENEIGVNGAKFIADLLILSKQLKILSLANNIIKNEGIKYIADALKINKSLICLYLDHNDIDDEGAEYIADALKINRCLTVLYIGYNDFSIKGIKFIINALYDFEFSKSHLTTLDLESCYNRDINDNVAEYIIELLNVNKCLTRLYLNIDNIRKYETINKLLKNNIINKEKIKEERAEEKVYFAVLLQVLYWQFEFLEFFDELYY